MSTLRSDRPATSTVRLGWRNVTDTKTPKNRHFVRFFFSLQLVEKLTAHYEEDPYPSVEAMEAMAKQYGAPDYAKIESFFVNMRLKHQETFQ